MVKCNCGRYELEDGDPKIFGTTEKHYFSGCYVRVAEYWILIESWAKL